MSKDNNRLTIGLLIDHLNDRYQSTIWNYISELFKKNDINLICISGGVLYNKNNLMSIDSYFNRRELYYYCKNQVYSFFYDGGLDGIISLSSCIGNIIGSDGLIKFYKNYTNTPLVSLGAKIPGYPSIIIDNTVGMKKNIEHLIKHHHKKNIAYISGPKSSEEAQERLKAYEDVLRKNNIPVKNELIYTGNFLRDSGTAAVNHFIKNNIKFDAIAAANDLMIFGAYDVLNQNNYKIPYDISVTGFDDLPEAKFAFPTLTTVSQPLFEMAEKSVSLILNLINGKKDLPVVTIPTKLIIRQSCGCKKGEGLQINSFQKIKNDTGNKQIEIKRAFFKIYKMIFNIFKIYEISQSSQLNVRLLVKTFLDIPEHQNYSDKLLQLLEELFTRIILKGYDRSILLEKINNFFIRVIQYVNNDNTKLSLNKIWINIYNTINQIAFQRLAYSSMISEISAYYIQDFIVDLVTSYDFEAFKRLLINQLNEYNLPACYIAVYTKNEKIKNQVGFIFSYEDSKDISDCYKEKYFNIKDIFPGTLKKYKQQFNIVLVPLSIQDEYIGNIFFDVDLKNKDISFIGTQIEILARSVSGAVKSTELLEKEKRNAEVLEKEVKKQTKQLNDTNIKLVKENKHRKKAEEALFHEKEMALITLESIIDGVITTDINGYIIYVNPVAEKLLGITNRNAVGKLISNIYNVKYEDNDFNNMFNTIINNKKKIYNNQSLLLINKDGAEYNINETMKSIKNKKGEIAGVIIIFSNITKEISMTRMLDYQSSHDVLTGLYNRDKFKQLVHKIISEKNIENNIMLLLDIDKFNSIINFGVTIGDQILINITHIIKEVLRDNDIIARIGEDEFAVILSSCNKLNAEKVADNICSIVHKTKFNILGKNFKITLSIGVVELYNINENPEYFFNKAKVASSLAKQKGGNQVYLYEEKDQNIKKFQEEISILPEINKALEHNRFVLFKQVIQSLKNPSSVHYEILIRMLDDNNKILSPGLFLPTAEQYDLMPKIDRWVIDNCLKLFRSNYNKYKNFEEPVFSINLGGKTLTDKNILDYILEKFKEYKIPTNKICFEITETEAITNLSLAIDFIKELKRIGCFFSLDDFGSGWSSFSYLKLLPVDFLKIDGSFIKEIINNELDRVFVETINNIGHTLKVKTIAEFVENEEILNLLKQLNIDYAQGYHISKPEPF